MPAIRLRPGVFSQSNVELVFGTVKHRINTAAHETWQSKAREGDLQRPRISKQLAKTGTIRFVPYAAGGNRVNEIGLDQQM